MPTHRTEGPDFGKAGHVTLEGNFTIEIAGINAGHFKAVDGLSTTLQGVGYQGGEDIVLRKQPAPRSVGEITLKERYIVTSDLQDWWETVQAGREIRKSITIRLKDDLAGRHVTWVLHGCRLKHWKHDPADKNGSSIVTYELTFVVEEMMIEG